MAIRLKTPDEIEKMRVAGKLAAEVLEIVAPYVKPGISTGELDQICYEHIVNVQKAIPANIGYSGYQHTSCISINDVVCHGIPSFDKKIKDGDILNIDVTVIKDGYHGDTSRMYIAGKPTIAGKKLCDVTQNSLYEPMVNTGDWRTRTMKDGWTVKTKDHGLSAQYEHTILVIDNGAEVLTLRSDEQFPRIIEHK